ncbi:TonB-dependent receptor [bacterium]|nr:TonB-dependent receptor [bacterium]
MRRKFFLPVCIILVFHALTPLSAGTTGKLEGVICDSRSGDPLEGVSVMILDTPLGTASGRNGFFSLSFVPAGKVRVRFQMIGYRELLIEEVEIRPDLKTRLPDIHLEQTPLETAPLVVRAELPAIQKDVTGTVARVPGENVNHLPVDNIREILGLQTGITRDGHIRGGRADEVLYLVDGIPVRDGVMGGMGLSIPRLAVQQMEIQTGGFDSEYGNVLSGVVNVMTHSGKNNASFRLRAESDDLPRITQKSRETRLAGLAQGPLVQDKIFYLAAVESFAGGTRWWQDFRHAFQMPVARQSSGMIRLDAQAGPAARITLLWQGEQNQWRDYEFSWRFNLNGLPRRRTGGTRAAFTWAQILSYKTFFTLILDRQQLRNRIGEEEIHAAEMTPYEYDFFLQYVVKGKRIWQTDIRQDVWTLQGDLTSRIHPCHSMKIGFQAHAYRIDGSIIRYEPQMTYFGKPIFGKPLLNYSTQYRYLPRSGNAYLQDKIELPGEAAVISLGLRYDFLDPRASRPLVEYVSTSPNGMTGEIRSWVKSSFKGALNLRLGFSAPLSESSFFFANIGTYSQFPAFHYLYAGINPVTLRNGMSVLKGNPDLEPERGLMWEISYKNNFMKNSVVTATYFSKQTRNQLDTKTFIPGNSRISGDYGFAEYVNQGMAEASGLELQVSRNGSSPVTGSLSLTWMTARGVSSTPEKAIDYFEWGFPVNAGLHYLSWDQRITLKANLECKLPLGLDGILIWQAHSARPFTYYPSADGIVPDDQDAPFLPNNRRMKTWSLVHLRLARTFAFRGILKNATLALDCRNALNTQNVLWMDSSGRIGGELFDPGAYDVGRRTRTVLEMTF